MRALFWTVVGLEVWAGGVFGIGYATTWKPWNEVGVFACALVAVACFARAERLE